MKDTLRAAIRSVVANGVGRERAERFIARATRIAGLDPIKVAYKDAGILNFEDLTVSGERMFLERYLAPRFKGGNPTVFDVGANIGEYAELLVQVMPGARVFSFEPNPHTFQILQKNLAATPVRCVPLGMSVQEMQHSMFVYPDNLNTPHATMHQAVISGYLECEKPREISCSFTSVDQFSERENIDVIDFLKIDAEGNELDVIRGAERMIKEKKVRCIQFEFGEADVYQRIFLKDFFATLPAHRFFRVSARGLIPLWNYSPSIEIFSFQNIVAVERDSPMAQGW